MKTDQELKQDVLEGLGFDRDVRTENLRVSVKNGTVTVRGYVPTYGDKLAAARVIKHISGVRALADNVTVHLSSNHRRTDADIAARALSAINWITTVPGDSLWITVNDGWLYLKGSVENSSQKEALEAAVERLTGVVGVTNLITLKPEHLQLDVKKAIKSSFKRLALLNAEKIDVSAEGARIILQGVASSIIARDEAERAAWATRGVTDVENHLFVVLNRP